MNNKTNVLELENGKKYVGHTNNPNRRIQEHKDYMSRNIVLAPQR